MCTQKAQCVECVAGKHVWHCTLAFPSTVTLLLHAPRIRTCHAWCLPSRLHCLLLLQGGSAVISRPMLLWLSADHCIVDRPLIYFMVGGNGYSRSPGNLDVFIPGNTEMEKSGNPGCPGNGSPRMNSLTVSVMYAVTNIIVMYMYVRVKAIYL